MRIPLLRFRGDDSTVAWWEWLFLPIVVPLLLLALLVIGPPLLIVSRFRAWRLEKKIRSRLVAVGRTIEWAAVETHLNAGTGTLIVEHCSYAGPIREWWTEDDLLAGSPVPLPTSLDSPPDDGQMQQYLEHAKFCAKRYVDTDEGIAKRTDAPGFPDDPLDNGFAAANLGGERTFTIRFDKGRMLAEKFPHGKVVTLLAWSNQPLLFKGDAEAVFQVPEERRAVEID